MKYEKITEQIIGCAYKVYNTMGFGYLESVYAKCMAIEFDKIGLKYEMEKAIIVYYENQVVGKFTADKLVIGEIILEYKSIRTLAKSHEVQLVNYLTSTRKDVGLLINFGEEKVEIKRKVRILN
ncbi:MAG: GxxExxY protein [Candidatus Marinimicrobia bacterium]|nr:GxxExxY protein [Candidatus Neomarinimicrobiota bacterium]